MHTSRPNAEMSTTPALDPVPSSTSSTVPDTLTSPESEPTRSVVKPGTLVTAESEQNEYKSLLSLAEGSGSARRVTADIIRKKIGSDGWTKEFNAFLNSRAGGTIHFGISDDCKVEEGVALNEKDLDKMKMRIGQLFEQFYPTTLSHYYDVHFIKLENGRYRFDVDIKPSSGRICFMSREKTEAYARSGPSCCKLKAEEIERRIQQDLRQRVDATVNACIEAQVILRIRDAQMTFPSVHIGSPSYEKETLVLLGEYSRMCDLFSYGIHVARALLQLLRAVVTKVRHGIPLSVANNVAIQAYQIQLLYGYHKNPGEDQSEDPSDDLSEYLDENDYYVLSEIYFQIAYDGILYRQSRELFMKGAVPLVSLVSKNANARTRYADLESTVLRSKIDTDEKQKCTKYLELLVDWEKHGHGCSALGRQAEDSIVELGFNYHI